MTERCWFYCYDCAATWRRESVYRRDEVCPTCKHNGATIQLAGAAEMALDSVHSLTQAAAGFQRSLEDE